VVKQEYKLLAYQLWHVAYFKEVTEMAKKIELDGEAADRITVLNLKQYRAYLKKELKEWKKNPRSDDNPNGYWLHPEDVSGNIRVIEALNLVIKQFGEQ
jgi:hypothetical protein